MRGRVAYPGKQASLSRDVREISFSRYERERSFSRYTGQPFLFGGLFIILFSMYIYSYTKQASLFRYTGQPFLTHTSREDNLSRDTVFA